jgi:outer membrane immunogenic protein
MRNCGCQFLWVLFLGPTKGRVPRAATHVGGGVELLCWSNIILDLEYDYVTLNLSNTPSCPLCDSGIVTGGMIDGDATISSVMLRASYLFPHED